MSERRTPEADAQLEGVIARVLSVYRSWGRHTTVAEMRADWDALFGATDVAATVQPVTICQLAAEWIAVPGADRQRVVLYFHGGGFQVGSLRSHRELMVGISDAAACRVLGLAYRLAPEHRHPAALDDACAAYDWLIAQGTSPTDIVFAGDSAGGTLALTALIRLRDAGRALPAGAFVMSAWTDMTAAGESYTTRAQSDPIHQRPMILAMARNALGPGGDPHDPLVSPLFADLHGLPPLLVQVGDRETVRSDSVDFAEKAKAAGVDVHLEVWDRMIHVFQQFPDDLPEARQARQSIGAFVRHLFSTPPSSRKS